MGIHDNHTQKDGSLMVMVLMLMTTLVFITYSALRTSSYFISLAKEREEYEKQYQLARALDTFGLIHYADTTKKSDADKILFKGPWPNVQSRYEGVIQIETKGNHSKILHIKLTHNGTIRVSFSRLIDDSVKQI
jgi:hypothetical protein